MLAIFDVGALWLDEVAFVKSPFVMFTEKVGDCLRNYFVVREMKHEDVAEI